MYTARLIIYVLMKGVKLCCALAVTVAASWAYGAKAATPGRLSGNVPRGPEIVPTIAILVVPIVWASVKQQVVQNARVPGAGADR
jgi:hypothetical protein